MAQPPVFRGNTYRKIAELDTWTKQRQEAALEPDLPIIDTHHHLWDDQKRGRYLVDELLGDIATGHNIIATVFVQTGLMYRADGPTTMKPVGEVEFANGMAAMGASGRYGKCRICAGIVGHASLTLGDQVQPVLEALTAAGNGRLRGIRDHVRWDANIGSTHDVPEHMLFDPSFRQGYACLQKFGLSYDVSIFYTQLPELADLARSFPDISVIICHFGGLLGIPPHDKRDEVFSVWRENLRTLAPFPNISVKLGGLGMLRCGFDFHLRDIPPSSEDLAAAWRPYVETSIELLGADRCLMESNFPADRQTCGYGVLWNAFKRITQGYSAGEKAALYHDTAARVYRLAV